MLPGLVSSRRHFLAPHSFQALQQGGKVCDQLWQSQNNCLTLRLGIKIRSDQVMLQTSQRTDSCPTAWNGSFQQSKGETFVGVQIHIGLRHSHLLRVTGQWRHRHILSILRVWISLYLCGFLKNYNLLCARSDVATVKKAQEWLIVLWTHRSHSCPRILAHALLLEMPLPLLACPERLHACQPHLQPNHSPLPPGQCPLPPLNSCSPHSLPTTFTTWHILSNVVNYLLYPVSGNRLWVPTVQAYLSSFL